MSRYTVIGNDAAREIAGRHARGCHQTSLLDGGRPWGQSASPRAFLRRLQSDWRLDVREVDAWLYATIVVIQLSSKYRNELADAKLLIDMWKEAA